MNLDVMSMYLDVTSMYLDMTALRYLDATSMH